MAYLNQQLSKYDFVCGDFPSLADVLYFAELMTIMALTKSRLPSHTHKNLITWLDRL